MPRTIDKYDERWGASNEYLSPLSPEEQIVASLIANTKETRKSPPCAYCYDGVVIKTKYNGFRCCKCKREMVIEEE